MYISSLITLAFLAATGLTARTASAPDTVWYDLMPREANADSSGSSKSANSSSAHKTPQKWKHFECGTDISQAPKEFLAKAKELHTKKLRSSNKGGSYNYARKIDEALAERQTTPAALSSISVDTYFHVVSSNDNLGTVTQDMVTAQIQAMNTAYNPYNVHFTLRNTSFTTNDLWAAGATSTDDMAMKNTLRQGTYASLNLYFQTDLAGGILGKCTLPAQITGWVPPSAYANDGCNINAQTMPGGWIDDYNLGQTAVHETGHWLGLLHVFENYSCDPSNMGDYIADTPQQSISTDGCPTNPAQDSCPSDPGVDAIHNIMDYSYDSCYEGLTSDQAERILTFWPTFRQGH